MPLPSSAQALKEAVRHALEEGRQLPERARHLPGLAVRTAVAGLGAALTVTDRVRQRYARARQGNVGPVVDQLRREGTGLLSPRGASAPEDRASAAEEPAVTKQPAPAEERAPTGKAAPAGEPVGAVAEATREGERAGGHEEAPGDAPARRVPRQDELPVGDYDRLSMESLRARLRTFTVSDLVLLLDYERAHANRRNIVTMFENRIAKLERQG